MSLNLFNGLWMSSVGVCYLAFIHDLIYDGILQITLGGIIVFLTGDIRKNKNLLLVINISALWFGFGWFIGPIVGLAELCFYYSNYFNGFA